VDSFDTFHINKKEFTMKNKQRRKFDSAYKAKIALEAVKELNTISELASKYDIHPNQIREWKRSFLENASRAFEGNDEEKGALKELESKQDELHKVIGEKEMEIDFLKKNLKKLNLL
jgi:transposase